jgi:adenine deaminase
MLRRMTNEPTFIRAGRFVDVIAGEVRHAQLITIRGDRIESVEPESGTYPEGVRDLSPS